MTVDTNFTIEGTAGSLQALVTFVTVAERRSFSGAARVLGVSTSAVSQSMRRLEAAIGLPLFVRTTRSVRPTDVGDRLLEEVGPAVRQATSALVRARAAPGEVTGTLRLSAPRIAVPVLRPLLRAYHAAHPKALVEISVDDRFVDIVRAGFDAGVRLGEAVDADMVGVPISPPYRFVIVGSPAYLRQRGRPRRPEDLAAHACIGWRAPTTGALYLWELEKKGVVRELRVSGPLVCDDGDVMLGAALDGMGLGYLPEPTVRAHVAEGALEVVLESWSAVGPGLTLYFPRRAQAIPKLRAFVDVVHASRRRRGV